MSDAELEYLKLADQPFKLITADTVNKELSEMNKDVKSWLEKHYSLTDLKLLLRAVANLAKEELASKKEEPKESAKSKTYQSSPEKSLPESSWLLSPRSCPRPSR